MLEVKKITRRYGDFLAVNGASFSVGGGEIIGLLGHNGAGKTTVMKMLSGYLEPDSGSVIVNGDRLSDNIEHVQSQIGYLPENLPIYPEMSVIDYLDYVAVLKGLGGQEKQDEIRHAIKSTDIKSKIFDSTATLSRGFKQRVGVAQALLGKPKLLILDEPTNGLDPQQTEHMRQLIRRIAKTSTVILSTHIMQEVEALCSRVLIMHSGELIVDAALDELRSSHELCLETSAAVKEGKALIKNISGISEVKAQPLDETGTTLFTLSLTNDVDLTSVSAEISKSVVHAGFALHRLEVVKEDLETLFRAVVTGKRVAGNLLGEVSHAA